MRPIIIFFASLFYSLQASCSDSLFTHTFYEEIEETIHLSDSIDVFIDKNNEYSIENILQSPRSLFSKSYKAEDLKFPLTIWSRIKLVNDSDKERFNYFLLCFKADSIWVHLTEGQQLISRSLSGSVVKATNKDMLTNFNLVPFNIDAGKEKTYYFKIRFEQSVEKHHLVELNIKSGKALLHKVINRFAFQSFFAGILTLFFIVSIFMFFIFHERVFIYFGLLMFFFSIYFLRNNFVLDTIFDKKIVLGFISISHVIITGITLFMFLFISRYISLRRHYPKYYRFYLYLSIFISVFAHLAIALGIDRISTSKIHNIMVIFWVIATMVPIFPLSKKGYKPAKILLISLGVLFFSSLLYIWGTFQLVHQGGIVQYGIQIGTILFAGILFYGLFDKVNAIRTEKQRFEELDQLKSRFFANISHEFRTPLTLILGPLQQLIPKQQNQNDKDLLATAHRNGNRLLHLINQLLDLSKLEVGKMTLKTSEVDFTALLKGITMSFESLADKKHIKLHFVSQNPQLKLHIDVDKIEKIFYNLLSNAFKFTKKQGEVSVMIIEQSAYIEIQVSDNGIGIPATRLSNIFNRFYQVDTSTTREQEGTGIGLALVKELVELHRGTISVDSVENKYTTFTIALQKGASHLPEHKKLDKTQEEKSENIGNSPLFNIEKKKETPLLSGLEPIDTLTNNHPLLLIIEDNDDVRNYIKRNLVNDFNVIEATNGQAGIDKALEHLPDLIISDVMMPKKNGYQVCETLKKDQRTSHIPIILLTAKAAPEEKLAGLETGADDYLIKPFDTQELEVRVRNLIKLRATLRERYSDSEGIEPSSLAINSTDQAFWQKVKDTVEENISNEQFSVEMLAREVGMSRVHLNRKLKALTDQSANKLIQSYRLRQALLLLQKKAGNVSEVAFQTGFSSTAYFVKCFREKYGKTPGSILN